MSIIIFLIVLAILVLVHEFGHFITAKKSGIKVEEFGLGFPPKAFGYKPKGSETEYTLNWIPFGGFVKIFGEDPDKESISGKDSSRSLINKPKYIQILVLSAGVLFNIIFAWILISLGFISGLPTSITPEQEEYARDISLLIITVVPNTPAEEAGLLAGDSILFVSTETLAIKNPTAEEVQGLISGSGGNKISVLIERIDVEETFILSPVEGIVADNYAVGISMDRVGLLKLPFFKAIWEGFLLTIGLLGAIVMALFNLVAGAFTGTSNLSQISGPVGIVSIVGDAANLGFIYLISFTAFISLNLAVINLIPFPALDGGRILFVLIEGIKGSPISPKIQNGLNQFGFALLIILMLVVTYNDIIKLF